METSKPWSPSQLAEELEKMREQDKPLSDNIKAMSVQFQMFNDFTEQFFKELKK